MPPERPSDQHAGATGRDARPDDRGRDATKPTEIPKEGWKDVFARVRAEAKQDNASLISAGVAFYSLLALVPGLVAMLSIYGLVAEPEEIQEQVVEALSTAPREVRELVSSQLESIAAGSNAGAITGVIVGILLALWSASSGIGHLIDALNVAYDEEETRSFVKRKATALAFTIGGILFLLIAISAIAFLPAVLSDVGTVGRVIAQVLRFVALFAAMIAALAVLYRYGPARDEPEWRWASPGAIVAALLFVIGSIAFSVYTANFGKYNETYGSLGAIVVVMLWLFITALSIVIGAELNAEIERQTARDTTEGPDRPIGDRDAYAADTVGETAAEVKERKKAAKNRS
jgi:membrane protein